MMSAVRGKDSKAEIAIRKALWSRGLRYRLHRASLPGRPDLVFPRFRSVLFVDSDFWHARALVEGDEETFRATIRGQRQEWWVAKLTRNAARDREVTELLEAAGWRVIRVWESDVLEDAEEVARLVIAALDASRQAHS